MTDSQRVLLTEGEYSYYGVSGLLEGPAEPSITVLVQQFLATYAQERTVIRQGYKGFSYTETYHDWEAAHARLVAEGAPVRAEDRSPTGQSLLAAWLIWRHGFRRVEYREVWGTEVREIVDDDADDDEES